LARLREIDGDGIKALSSAIDNTIWPELALLARRFLAALPRAVPPTIAKLEPLTTVPLPLQPCIRDIWHDHVLFTGSRVTGLIDFGTVSIDTPATDIARLLGSLVDATPVLVREESGKDSSEFGVWQDGLAAYATIRLLSQTELLAVAALDDAAPILAGCNWIRWIYTDGREFENRGQIVARFRRIISRIDNLP
jgi:Ser/Thr protein kinase RdoA (MazF antagonist)